MQESSLNDGKNLILFMFLYVLGDVIKKNADTLMKIRTVYLVTLYLLLNVLVVSAFVYTANTTLGKGIWHLSYPYCSPILILNGVLLFLLFGRMRIRSRIINYLASSVFAVYILHHQHYVLYSLIEPISLYIYYSFHNHVSILLALGHFSITIVLACIFVDKLFTPLWHFLKKFSKRGNQKLTDLSNLSITDSN